MFDNFSFYFFKTPANFYISNEHTNMLMSDETVTPHVSYIYNTTTNASGSLGGPMFILLYMQCIIFVINQWFDLSMEYWQLVFPTFVVVITFAIGMFNQRSQMWWIVSVMIGAFVLGLIAGYKSV